MAKRSDPGSGSVARQDSHLSPADSPRQEDQRGEASAKNHWVQRLDVVARFTIGIAGLVLSAAIGSATIQLNDKAAQRQIQAQSDSLALQRRMTAAQMLVAQMPLLLRGTDQERALTLRALESLDPVLVGQIGDLLLAGTKNSTDSASTRGVIASNETAQREDALLQHLTNAKKYRDFILDAQAAREYLRAYDVLPDDLKTRYRDAVLAARSEYESGQFSRAVGLLANAFDPVEHSLHRK